MALVLIVGGVRSGKSEVAERIAAAAGAPVCYLATGRASDPEMAERIERHQATRPAGWRTICSPDPARAEVAPGETLLVDGVAPWLAARMGEEGLWTDEAVAPLGEAGRAAYRRVLERVRTFAVEAARRPGLTVTVAEESGLGVIPVGAGLRRYLDLAGEAIQLLARHADRVVLVVAGRAIDLDPDDHLPRTLRHDRPISPWPATAPLPLPVDLPRGRADPRPGRADLTPGGAGLPPDRTDLLRLHGDAMVSPGQLDFAVSVVAGGPPAWMRDQLASALDRLGGYPDERSAVRAVAARHGRSSDEVVATNGSADAFWLLAQVLRPRLAVVVHPSFTEPEAALRAAGHPVERAFRDPNDFTLDPCAVPDEADLVVVCNPNNPTGTLDPAAVLARLARPGRVLVVDEAFMEFVPGESESLAKPGADVPGLVVVRSLTKLWSLPGLRAGYLLAPPGIAAAVRETRQPWSVNAPACAALAVWALRTATPGGAEVTAMARDVEAARADLAAGLTALPGVRVWPSAANFLLLRVPDGPSVRAGLARRGIAVRRADTFPGLGPHHLRVAVRSPPDTRLLVEALAEVLDSTPTSATV
jgi:histidinol-phosphate/aromatic aminotransferase/cobyric acid decarboxylase-like protein/adenosyl cobinamide kinase/adenosyl cobinamide phosphate guanylyltransferase